MNPNEFKSRIKALSEEQQKELLAILKRKLAENKEKIKYPLTNQ